MKKIIITFVLTCCTANADTFLLGDSWLANTYNPNANSQIGFHVDEPLHNFSVNSMPSKTVADEIKTYGIQAGDFVIIDIGLPDFFNRLSQSYVQENLFYIVDYLASLQVKVVFSCPAVGHSNEDLQAKVRNKSLKTAWKLCENVRMRQPEWVRVVDLQAKLLSIETLWWAPDHAVHLNEDGAHIYNIALANERKRFIGTCNQIDGTGIVDFYDRNNLNQEQRCIAGQLMENYWLGL